MPSLWPFAADLEVDTVSLHVTQVFGLRAFQSQLLCEQVVGRGLRRMNYDFDLDENGVPQNEEYVDIYGIPTKKKPGGAPGSVKAVLARHMS